jgi:hypothetical protein
MAAPSGSEGQVNECWYPSAPLVREGHQDLAGSREEHGNKSSGCTKPGEASQDKITEIISQ